MKGVTIVGKSLMSAPWEAERVSQAGRPRGHGRVAAQARLGGQPLRDGQGSLVPFPIPSSFPPRAFAGYLVCQELCSHQGVTVHETGATPTRVGPGFTGKADICSVISDTRVTGQPGQVLQRRGTRLL